ncbi:universal stress protein [Halostella sp. JP-L12]|uniref:universal stress protein n=1 Tax=Halostella TaxID=1843185 RepID=UPI000EF7AD0A|nr:MULTISPECIES: HPP family protein [Halostella]NHN47017.1 universal stress protein [Halostella sp. JP-L12]
MFDALRTRYRDAARRLRRVERREIRDFHRWIEHTDHLVHASALLAVPLLVVLVTVISNAVPQLSFLLFPPLASGTYTLFSDPEGRYSSPRRFVAGLTLGAASGWLAIELGSLFLAEPVGRFEVSAPAAALAVFLTGALTWALDVEEPSAYACGLLVLLIDASPFAYVVSVFTSTSIVALVFLVWRREFYENRARYLYRSTKGDDHVLVPMRGDRATATAYLGARLAAAHDAGKVVLFATVPPDADGDAADASGGEDAVEGAADALAHRLESCAANLQTKVGVPCQVVVASSDAPAKATLRTAREENCDLVATPYEQRHGHLSSYVRSLFGSDLDVVAARVPAGERRWRRVLVPIRSAGERAHAKVEFACRLAGPNGRIAVATCIDDEHERRRAEAMLADVVEAFDGPFETRVVRDSIESFLATTASTYDLTIIGASTDRTAASRFISPPTFERIDEVDAAVAVVHLG